MTRKWKPIVGYEGLYQISNKGEVLSLTYNRVLKNQISKTGYERVLLYKNGYPSLKQVHRLVMEAFMPNVYNHDLPINHIDGVKTNNSVDNLEMTTPKRNIKHAVETGLIKSCKVVIQRTLDGKFIKKYPSASQAARENGLHHSQISRAANGELRTSGGYIWSYEKKKTKRRKKEDKFILESFLNG